MYILFFLLFFTFKASHVLALTPADQSILNQQQILQQQQEQQRQQEVNQQQINEAERIRRTRSGIAGGSDDLNSLLNGDDLIGSGKSGETCRVYFKEFRIYGNKVISAKTIKKKVLNKYIKLNKCINKKNIESLQNELMKFYIDKGYSNTRIYFDFNSNNNQDIKQGIFTIVVEEGLVNDIIMIDERYNKKLENKKIKQEKKLNNQNKENQAKSPFPLEGKGLGVRGSDSSIQNVKNENNRNIQNSKNNQNSEQNIEENQEQNIENNNNKETPNPNPSPQAARENHGINQEQMKYKTEKKDNNTYKPIQESSYHKYRMKAQSFFAFPLLKGKAFNLKDYEQGLDQINRLQSNNATMSIKAMNNNNQNGQLPSHLRGRVGVRGNNEETDNKKDNKKDKIETPNQTNMEQAPIDLTSPQGGSEISGSFSNIYILNQSSFPISFNLGIDNSGNKSTGENTANISLNIDNLISVNDNIYLKYTQDTDSENTKRYNKSFYSNLSVPLGYWTFTTSLSYSKYLTTIQGYVTSFTTSGNTLTNTYNADRVMYRSQLYRFNIGSDLTIRDTESYIRDLKSLTGSRKSSNISFYINNTIYTKLGTIIIKPSYQKGLDWFGSKKDEADSSMLKTEPRLQYDLLKLYVYYNTRVNFPLFTKTQVIDPNTGQAVLQEVEREIVKIDKETNKPVIDPITNKTQKEKIKEQVPYKVRNKIQLNYTLTFDSQYSFDTLYGTDQFSVGGEYSVRGYRNSNISGDNGYYIRNDLRVNLQQLFPRLLLNTKPMTLGHNINKKQYNLSITDALSRTYISIFYDYGYVENKHKIPNDRYNSNSGYMDGVGVALNYYGRYLTWSLTYAKALHSPEYLQSRDGLKKEESNWYWRVGGKF